MGIQTGYIRNIQAVRFLVHSQIFRPSSHSMILCMTVSCSTQLEQRGEPASGMACSRSIVGRMSWMTLNQLTVIESAAHVACRFAHTLSQSVVGYIIVMRTFLRGFAASLILGGVSYTLALKILGASPCLGVLHMPCPWRIYASIPTFLESTRQGAGFISASVGSNSLAIRRLSLRHDDFASMSDIVRVLCTLFPNRLGPTRPSSFFLQCGVGYPTDEPGNRRHYLTNMHARGR